MFFNNWTIVLLHSTMLILTDGGIAFEDYT